MANGWVGKRLVIIMIIALSLSTVLAGCSKKAENGKEEPGAVTTSKASAAPEESKAAEPEAREDIKVSVYDRGNIPPDEGNATENRWTKWINENGPANVEFVGIPRGEEEAKFNTLAASGGLPDLIFTWSSTVVNTLLSQKQLMPLDDLIDKYSTDYKQLLDKYPAVKRMGMKADGKMYAFGMVLPFDIEGTLWVRADWLRKLNLEVPKTTDEIYQVIKAFTEQDPDGNGKKDTFGINMSSSGGESISQMFAAQGLYSVNGDGQYKRIWDREAAAIAFKKRLYDEKLVDKDFLTDQNGEKAQQDFVNGKLGVFGTYGGVSGIGLSVYETLKTNNPNAEVIAIPLPKSEFGQFSPNVSSPMYTVAVVNAQAKHPEAVMKYIDFIVRESTAKTLKYGLEGVNYKTGENGRPQPIDADKNTKELSWTADLHMLSFDVLEGKCADYLTTLDMNKPIQKEYAEIVKQARDAYLNPDRPIYYDIDYSSLPSLTQDLQTAQSNAGKSKEDLYAKAIVGGSSYTAEQASKDAKEAWDRAGGNLLDGFYAKWFTENKDKVVFTKDYNSMKF